MKKLLVVLSFLLHGVSFAQCPHTFTCTQQGCFKVADNSCSLPMPVVTLQDKDGNNNQVNPKGAVFTSPVSNQVQSSSSISAQTFGCAENGSCYGDTSLINGMPKTINVEGYYRKDGTYVRGHYRSKGR